MNSKKLSRSLEKRSKDWTVFTELTLKSLQDIENATGHAQASCKTIEGTMRDVKELSKHARAKSYVQICKLGFVEALITHTGEYNVELNPEYQCTLTAAQTIDFLEEKLTEQNSVINACATQKDQLQRRLGFDLDRIDDDIADTKDMPGHICSDRGIAIKHCMFYEIIEEEPDETYVAPTKRISRIKE